MDQSAPIFFDAEIRRNETLPPKGMLVVFGVAAVFSLGVSVGFFLNGAWPVLGFFGLDLLALAIAFRVVARRAKSHETIRIDEGGLIHTIVHADGRIASTKLDPYWLRVEVLRGRGGRVRLMLRHHQDRYELASFLLTEEKEDLAGALARALERFRNHVPQT